DLDETVLDNSGFQSYLDRAALDYSDKEWDRWEGDYPEEVGLVPGAKPFIDKAEALGVTVIYITNRTNRVSTARALEHNKLNTADLEQRLFVKTGDSSNKTSRREQVAAKYRVLQFFGDNLRD